MEVFSLSKQIKAQKEANRRTAETIVVALFDRLLARANTPSGRLGASIAETHFIKDLTAAIDTHVSIYNATEDGKSNPMDAHEIYSGTLERMLREFAERESAISTTTKREEKRILIPR